MTEQQFHKGDYIVYPAHGVGKVMDIEEQEIGGMKLTFYVLYFDKERMTLRIPLKKAPSSGLRALCSDVELKRMHRTLKGKARVGRGMWSRRAKEYESKINSGNIISLAEVVRDLHKNVDDPERSYSERMIYENALERLAGEIAAVESINYENAEAMIVKTINDNKPKETPVDEMEEAA